jgi:hypothetical protein
VFGANRKKVSDQSDGDGEQGGVTKPKTAKDFHPIRGQHETKHVLSQQNSKSIAKTKPNNRSIDRSIAANLKEQHSRCAKGTTNRTLLCLH